MEFSKPLRMLLLTSVILSTLIFAFTICVVEGMKE